MAETGREAFERAVKAKWPNVELALTKDKCGEYIDETWEDIHDGWILCVDDAIAKLRAMREQCGLGACKDCGRTLCEYHEGQQQICDDAIAALEEMKQ